MALRKKLKQKLQKFIEIENDFVKDLLATVNTPDSFEKDDDAGLNFKGIDLQKQKLKENFKLPVASIGEESFSKTKQKKTKSKTQKAEFKKRAKMLKKLGRKQSKTIIQVEQIKKEAPFSSTDDKEDVKNNIKEEPGAHKGALIFSKVAFKPPPGVKVKKEKREKTIKNPIESLKRVKAVRKKFSELEETGDNKVDELKKELLWKKALDKIEGKTVKDDSKLLYKAIKRKKDKHQKSKAKWIERKKNVEKTIKEKEQKRSENIKSRIQKNKSRKLARLCKKGHIIK